MPAYKSNVTQQELKSAYKKGYESLNKINIFNKTSQISMHCAFAAGVSDRAMGYILDLSVFN